MEILEKNSDPFLNTLIKEHGLTVQRNRAGWISIKKSFYDHDSQKDFCPKVCLMEVDPLWETNEQLEPAIAIRVLIMDEDIKTRIYPEEKPVIVVKPTKEGTISVSVDETYGIWNPTIDLQQVISDVRIGLSMLDLLGTLPRELASRFSGRVLDEMTSRSELIQDLLQGAPIIARATNDLDKNTPHQVPSKEFVNYAIKILGKPQEFREGLPDGVLNGISTYNQFPKYSPCIYHNLVYQETESLFERKVSNLGLANGQGFIETIRDLGHRIQDVSFLVLKEGNDDINKATNLIPSAYIFNSKRNAIVVLDQQGKAHEIKVNQFRVCNSQGLPENDKIRIQIPHGAGQDHISVEFSLVHHVDPSASIFGVTPDTDRLVIITKTPLSEGTKISKSLQESADYYLNILMILDPITDREELNSQMPFIFCAMRDLFEKKVCSIFPPDMINAKFIAAAGDFVKRSLDLLIQNNIQNDLELQNANYAIIIMESKDIEYPVTVDILKQRLKAARNKLLKKSK